MKFKVVANPKPGTCYQFVEAETEEDAINIAKSNPDGWLHAHPKTERDWHFRAFQDRPREFRSPRGGQRPPRKFNGGRAQ